MNIKVLYFARLKEAVNYSTEDIDLPADVATVTARSFIDSILKDQNGTPRKKLT